MQDEYIKKHSVVIGGRHDTSVSLEEEFWDMLKEIANKEKKSINQIITEIDKIRRGSLSSAIRLFILDYLKKKK